MDQRVQMLWFLTCVINKKWESGHSIVLVLLLYFEFLAGTTKGHRHLKCRFLPDA